MISSIVTSGDFAQTNTCSSALASNAHCTIQVTFKPTAPRIRQGSLSVTDNAQRSPQTVSLSGLGVGPVVQLSPTAVTFATRLVGTASAAQTVTLTNTGNGMLTISGITTTGDFTRTHNCGTTVAAGASCIISVTFKPTAKGVRSGLLTVTDNAAGGQQTVTLKGTGTVVQLSTTRLTFGTQTVGTTTAAKTVRLTNIGTTVLSITSITITGTNAGDFTQTNTCGVGVAAGGSCVITAKFKPTLKGTRIATVSVSDNGGGSPQSVSLLGTGTVVSLSPTTLNFGSQKVGTISAAKIVTLTNVGTTTLNITSITKSGSDPGDFSLNNTCGKSVASGGKCSIIVRFIPTTAGLRTAMVNINDDGGGSPQNVPLSGNGT